MHSAYVMVVDATKRRVALVERDGIATLPKVEWRDGEPVDIAAALDGTTRVADGATDDDWVRRWPPLTILSCLAESTDDSGAETVRTWLYLCEPVPGISLAQVADGWWSSQDHDLDLPAALTRSLRSTLAIVGDGDTADGDWSYFNLPGATATITATLASSHAAAPVATMYDHSVGRRPTDLRQLRGWWLSSVWQNDEVVFKTTHPSWPSEPAVNELLSRVMPEHTEPILASGFVTQAGHAPTPWMVQHRAKARPSDHTEDGDLAQDERHRLSLSCVEVLARIQLALVGREPELRAAGVADRTIAATRAALESLWASPELESLDASERAALPVLEKHILSRLDALEALGTEPLLAHGDLHLGNVVQTSSGELKLIDWTDAALSWPGVDLMTLLPRRADTVRRDAIVGAYELALGERFGPSVRPGLELADVFHAISYAKIEAFLPRSGRWELGGTVRFLVKRQLELVMR
ncbi:MAG TPA: aminoglycoside phosphotransferase family protein [Trueperaceae bacterium]|nr:aminoglycoside phosphotransferase family protein [Trueperaceae bacterium]